MVPLQYLKWNIFFAILVLASSTNHFQRYSLHDDGSYSYSYDTGEGLTAGQSSDRNNQVQGYYRYKNPDGSYVNLKYTSGTNGYIPEVEAEEYKQNLAEQYNADVSQDGTYYYGFNGDTFGKQEYSDHAGNVVGRYYYTDEAGTHDLSYIAGDGTGFIVTGGSLYSVLKGLGPNSIVPSGVVPNSIETKGFIPNFVPSNWVPNGAVPGVVSNGVVPNGAVPNGVVPNGVAPNGAVPNGAVPNGVVPNGVAPNDLVPSGVAPNGVIPNGVVPSGVEPNGVQLHGQVPNAFIPNNVLPPPKDIVPNNGAVPEFEEDSNKETLGEFPEGPIQGTTGEDRILDERREVLSRFQKVDKKLNRKSFTRNNIGNKNQQGSTGYFFN